MRFPLAIVTQSPCFNLILNHDFYLYTPKKYFQNLYHGETLKGTESYWYKGINIGKTAAKCQHLPNSPDDSFV